VSSLSVIRDNPTARAAFRRFTWPVGSLRAVRTDAPHIVLTYDDGPDVSGTEAVLGALAEYGASATFFVLVGRAGRHRGLLREIVGAGHEVGLHGIDHVRLTNLSAAEVFRRTREGRARLEDLLGDPVRWFRPPYGAQLPRTWLAIRRAGLVPVLWGPTPGDWLHLPERELAANALVGSGPGQIVLAHDGHPGPDEGVDHGPAPPIDRHLLTRLMLDQFGERGLVGRSLSDALADGTQARWAWFLR
jgi:peptidoglycan/xylan/chitin deacetylase (PgdA/CDA1 family)